MMKREPNPLAPLNFHKQNPIYPKLVLFFLLLGLTIFLFSSRTIDYENSSLQTQTALGGFTSLDTVARDNGFVLETKTLPEVDSQEAEIELQLTDKGSAPSTLKESHSEDVAPPTWTQSRNGDSTPSAPTESHNDVAAPIDSTELGKDEAATATSNETHKDDVAPNSTKLQTELQKDDVAPPTSTELLQNKEAVPSTSTELSQNKEAVPSTSTESQNNAPAPPTSTELSQKNAPAPPTSTELSQNKEAEPSTSTESQNNAPAQPTSTESPNTEAVRSNSTESQNNDANKQCDLFKGDWVPNPSGPPYNNYTCKWIEGHQDCIKNGRPDSAYLYWKWKPNDCELPKFNPQRFLEFMRNKYFAFVGDSISRNHVQSILCVLSQVDEPKIIYLDEEWRSSTWLFPTYNFTIARVWAPFLLKADTFEDSNGVASSDIQLHIDKLDEAWIKEYHNYDYMIISGGKWYTKTAIYYENNKIIGCHSCDKAKNLTEIPYDYVYRRAVSAVFGFITSSTHKPKVLFRTIAPSHFEGGDWSHGGRCRRKVPFKENEVNLDWIDQSFYGVQMEEFYKTVGKAWENGVELRLFDTTKMSLLRPDGHPGEYRQFQPFAKDKNAIVQSDCLHWCMPGPIDSWNDLLMETLMGS